MKFVENYTYPKHLYIEAFKQQKKAAQKALNESVHARYHPWTIMSVCKAAWIAGNSTFDEYNAWEAWRNRL